MSESISSHIGWSLVSRWNLLGDIAVTAKTVQVFKSRLEKERVKKMGLFLDYSLDKQAVMEIQSVHPASILQADLMALYHELFIPKAFKYDTC